MMGCGGCESARAPSAHREVVAEPQGIEALARLRAGGGVTAVGGDQLHRRQGGIQLRMIGDQRVSQDRQLSLPIFTVVSMVSQPKLRSMPEPHSCVHGLAPDPMGSSQASTVSSPARPRKMGRVAMVRGLRSS